MTKLTNLRLARKKRIRARLAGSTARPRLTVYRSLTQLSAQIVDDSAHRTLVAASTKHVKAKPNMDGAKKLGTHLAKLAKDAGVTTVVFDRNAYRYHGRVKALADAARDGGLTF
jgi:large subunit ribosomal protein L18